MTTRTPIDPRTRTAGRKQPSIDATPVPKSVIAFFAVLRKVLGKAEDHRESFQDDTCRSERGAWQFRVAVEPDELDGGYVAECIDVPGAMGQGDTEREAVQAALAALKDIIDVRLEQRFEDAELSVPDYSSEHHIISF